MNEDKLKQLKEENKQLEANMQVLSALNSQLKIYSYKGDDEIDLRELWKAIWIGKWLIIVITAVFAIGAVFYALSVPNEYKSTVLLVPTSSSSSSSISKLAGQFGGLASLAGINMGGGGDDKSAIAIEILKTWHFLEQFIQQNHIEVEVFAAEGWNRATNKLVINPELYNETTKGWVREFDEARGQTVEPSGWELYNKIKDRIIISQNKESGLVSLSVEYYSPIIAKEWVNELVKMINAYFRKQDREEALKSIQYLEGQVRKTNVTDMQSVFYQLIEEKTKTLTLAEVTDEYIFKTVSHAKVAEERSKPKQVLIVILALILGGILSILIVLIRHFKPNTH